MAGQESPRQESDDVEQAGGEDVEEDDEECPWKKKEEGGISTEDLLHGIGLFLGHRSSAMWLSARCWRVLQVMVDTILPHSIDQVGRGGGDVGNRGWDRGQGHLGRASRQFRESLKVGNVLITGSSGLQERARADCGLWRPVRGPSGSPAPSGPFPLSRSSLLLLAHKLASRHISQHLLPGVENLLPLVVGNFF